MDRYPGYPIEADQIRFARKGQASMKFNSAGSAQLLGYGSISHP
jgi:hypothetical protein